jgi:hypothetical protein
MFVSYVNSFYLHQKLSSFFFNFRPIRLFHRPNSEFYYKIFRTLPSTIRYYEERIIEIITFAITKVRALSCGNIADTTPKENQNENEYFNTNLLNQLLFPFRWIIVWIFILHSIITGHAWCVLLIIHLSPVEQFLFDGSGDAPVCHRTHFHSLSIWEYYNVVTVWWVL